MRKLPTYPMLLAVMLVCITANVGYASAIDCLTYEYRGNQVTRISDDTLGLVYYGAYDFVDGTDKPKEYFYDSNGNVSMASITGPVVDSMNQIRRELNKQGFNYGERLIYESILTEEGHIIPFNSTALDRLKSGQLMRRNDYYIKY